MANTTGKKFGGRQAGSLNKKTLELKAWVKNLLETNQQQIEADLQALEAKDRVQMFERLLKYVIAPAQELDPVLKIQLEYAEIENLFKTMPDKAVEILTNKLINLKNTENEIQ